MNEVSTTKKEGHFGPIIGSVIIVVLIILGGLYFWKSIIKETKSNEEVQVQQNTSTDLNNTNKESEQTEATSTEENVEKEPEKI
jgi:uncharacterized protein HemX